MEPKTFIPPAILNTGGVIEVGIAIAQGLDYATTSKVNLVICGIAGVLAVGFICYGVVVVRNWWKDRRPTASADDASTESAAPEHDAPKPSRAVIALSVVALVITSLSALAILVLVARSALAASAEPPPTTSVAPPPITTPTSSATSSTLPPPPPTTGPTVAATFSEPTPGQSINAGDDVAVAGTVHGLSPGSSLWLMTQPQAGGGSYFFTNGSAVATYDRDWSFPDRQVGDVSDKGKTIDYDAVLANSTCSAALTQAAANDAIDALPDGCTVVARVTIRVNK
ncbi:hypothetical protein [Amycolatopsis sp. NPDC051102]|uniref:hypothetical protein n=1 Tax=Amycolatopsis sp. NPDC051102 TaxID=3155163 RepID=UPI003424A146